MVGPESVSDSDEETALEAELRETSLLVASASQQAEARRKQDQAVKRRTRCSLKLKHDQLAQSQRDRVVLANALRAQKKRTSRQAAEITNLRHELDLFRHNQLHDLAGDYDELLRTVRAHETAQDYFRQDLAQMQLAKQAAEFEAQTQAAAASAMREKLVESDLRVKTLEEKVARETEQRRALKERLLVLQERLCNQDNDSTVRLVTEAYERKIQDLESRHLKAQHKWFLESKRIIAKSEEDISARYKSIADAAIESARKTTAAKANKQREEHRQLLEQMAQSRAESVPLHAHQNVVKSLEREISETRARLAAAEQGMHTDALHARALDRDLYTAKQATDRTRVRMETDLAARSNALELLQERLQDANSRLDNEQRRVQQLEAARARELAASKSESARAGENRVDLEATKRELEHMRGRHKIARETWEAKLEAMRVKVTRLEARLEAKSEDMNKSAAAHKTELDALKGELAVTLQTLNTVSVKHEALQSTVQVLVPEVKHARVAETSAQHRSQQLEKAAGQSMQEHRAAENSLRAKLRTEQHARRRAENLVARHAAGLRALKSLCKKLQTAKERAERDLCEAQGALQARLCSVESRLEKNSNPAGDHASSQQIKLDTAQIEKADLIMVEEQKS